MKAIQYISTKASVTNVDKAKRIVTGYASKFGNIDRDDDIIYKGAFAKTISERGPQGTNEIFFLFNHDTDDILGKPSVLKEDDIGLYFEATISDTQAGRDALALYEDNVLNQHSVGFQTIKSDFTQVNGNTVQNIREVKLYEFSAVLWGANPDTPFLGFKGMAFGSMLDRLLLLQKQLHTGNLSDETYKLLELESLQLKTEINNAIASKSEPLQNTQKVVSNPLQYIVENLTFNF